MSLSSNAHLLLNISPLAELGSVKVYGWREKKKNRRNDSHATYYMQEEVGVSQAERDRGG